MTTPTEHSAQAAQHRVAEMLITHGALVDLSLSDALVVVRYMTPRRFAAGQVLMREGEDACFLLLVVDGEVTVENTVHSEDENMVVSVLGPGSIIGEMCVIDGGRRSATCVAASHVNAALMHSDQLAALIRDDPQVGVGLLLALSRRVVEHLRETNRKLVTFAQLSKALQQELDQAHSANRRLVEEITRLKTLGISTSRGN